VATHSYATHASNNILPIHYISVKNFIISTLTIDNKEYVVLPKKEYEALRTKAASKTATVRKLTLKQGEKLANQLIDKWSKGN
jgi:hypothetical protein